MALFRHFSLKSNPSAILPQFPSYAFASCVQTAVQQEHLAWKAQPPASRGPPPLPSLITFTPTPTYTLGRRQTEPLSESEVARLRSPLFVPTSTTSGGSQEPGGVCDDVLAGPKTAFFLPAITHAPRGGLTTYHGPGQLVVWPVIDLHSPLHAHLSVRDYSCLLEKTTIAALDQVWGLAGFTTANPGVWVRSGNARRECGNRDGERDGGGAGDERKIAALGVHLRRHVTALGVAINYSTPVTGPVETNPWGRIVACGLEDRSVTSVCAELGIDGNTDPMNSDEKALDTLADAWRSEFHTRLKMNKDIDSEVDFNLKDFEERTREMAALVKSRNDVRVSAQHISALAT